MTMKMLAGKLIRHTLFALPLALAPTVSSVVIEAAGLQAPTFTSAYALNEAQKHAKKKAAEAKKKKTKKTYLMSPNFFKKLEKVNEKTEAEDWQGALKELGKIRRILVRQLAS